MTKNFQRNLITILLLLISSTITAQVNWFGSGGITTAFSNVTVCDTTTFSLVISNNTPDIMDSNRVKIDLPDFLEYIPGSFAETSVPTTRNLQEFDISNVNIPVFQFDNLNGILENVSFTYRVKAKCGASINSSGVFIELSFLKLGVIQTNSPSVNGSSILNLANVDRPTLNIVNIVPSSYNGNVGDTYTQTITIRNAGLGTLDGTNADVFAKVVLDSTSCIEVLNPSLGTLLNDTLSIPSALFPGGDNKWSNNEDLVISYTVKVNCCQNPLRGIQSYWGCDANICEFSSPVNSNIAINNTVPNLKYYSLRAKRCFNGDVPTDSVMIVNIGSGPATNLNIRFEYLIPASGSSISEWGKNSFSFLDANGNLAPIDSNNVTPDLGYPTNGPCYVTTTNTTRMIDVLVPGLIQPGDTSYLILNTQILNTCQIANGPGSCWPNGYCNYGAINFETILTNYQDQCGGGSNYSPRQILGVPQYFAADNFVTGPTDVNDKDSFLLKVNFTFVVPALFTQQLYFDVTMDPCFTFYKDPIWVDISTGLELSLPYVQLNATTYRINITDLKLIVNPDKIYLPLKLNCSASPCTGQFSFNYYWNPDSICGCPLKIYCNSFGVTPHCGSCSTGGATPIFAGLKRISLGLPDNNNDGTADSTGFLDMSKIETGIITGGDTIELTQIVRVYPNTSGNALNGQPFSHIFCNMSTYAFDFWNPIGSATAIVYPYTGGAPYTCFSAISETSPGQFGYVFTGCGAGFNGDNTTGLYDSIIITTRYVTNLMKTCASGNLGTYIWDNDLYSTYTGTPDANYIFSSTPGDRYTCDHYNASITVAGWDLDSYAPLLTLTGCTNRTFYQYNRYDINGNNADNVFPYEYRPFAISDTFIINLPPGFTYEEGSAEFRQIDYYAAASFNIAVPTAPVSITGNINTGIILTFAEKNKFTTFGGTIPPADEAFWNYVSVRVQPTCIVPLGVQITSNNYPTDWDRTTITSSGLINNFQNIESAGPSLWSGSLGYQAWYPRSIIADAAQPSLNGGGTVNTFSNNGIADLIINNLSNINPMVNSWIYIESTNLGQVVEVKDTSGNIYTPINGYYQLGTVASSGSLILKVQATTSGCDTGKYIVYCGFDCVNYPTTPPDLTIACIPKANIKIVGFPAGTDAEISIITNNSNGTVDLCEPIAVNLKMNATQLGNLVQLTNEWFVPFGYTPIIDSIKIEYPVGTPKRLISNVAAVTYSNSILSYSLNSLDISTATGILGSYDTLYKEVNITIPFLSSCASLNGDFISVRYKAVPACGDTLPTIFKTTNPISFNQVNAPGYSTGPFGSLDTIRSCNPTIVYDANVTYAINYINAISKSDDSLFLTLPEFIIFDSYDPNAPGQSFNPASQPNGPTNVGAGRFRYSWPMTPGLITGDSIKIKYKYRFDYNLYSNFTGVNDKVVAFTGTAQTVTCGATFCNLLSINGVGNTNLNIKLSNVELGINGNSSCYIDQYGDYNTVTNILVCNTSATPMPNADTIKMDLYYDNNSNGFFEPATDIFIKQFVGANGLQPGQCDTVVGNFKVNKILFPNLKFIYVVRRQANNTVGSSICIQTDTGAKYYLDCPPQSQILGNYVWNDINEDGIQNANELGVAGVMVELVDINGNVISTTNTDAYGIYQFNDFGVGDFKVRFTIPPNYIFTKNLDAAGNSQLATVNNSDVMNKVIGETNYFYFGSGVIDYDLDAGIHVVKNTNAIIGDYVWHDLNANGIQDAGEPGIAGVVVTLYDNNGFIWETAITNESGYYNFDIEETNLTYQVGFTAPIGFNPTPNVGSINIANNSVMNTTTFRSPFFNVAAGSINLNIDAGFVLQDAIKGSLGNKVWYDQNQDGLQTAGEPGIQGATIFLLDNNNNLLATTITNALGEYVFNNLSEGIYKIQISPITNYVITTANTGANNAIDNDVDPISLKSDTVYLALGEKNMTMDVGLYNPTALNSVGDYVWNDFNKNGVQDATEVGVPGVTVTLYNASLVIIATTMSDANGFYTFAGLPDGNYIVGFSNVPLSLDYTMQTFNTTNGSDVNINSGLTPSFNLSGGVTKTDIDCGLKPEGDGDNFKGNLGDRVWYDLNANGLQEEGEPGVAGVKVVLYNATTSVPLDSAVTNASGNYLFTNLNKGDYLIKFDITTLPTANAITPNNIDGLGVTGLANSDANAVTGFTSIISLAEGANAFYADMGILPKPNTAMIGDKVWFDVNKNNLQSPDEPGVPGVAVTLYNNLGVLIASTTTDVNGNYYFMDVNPGIYRVLFNNLPTGLSLVTQTNNTATGSDANPVTGFTDYFTINAGDINLDIDAGISIGNEAALGNYVWYDNNANGLQDDDEVGVQGVLVTLYDVNGIAVTSTVTDNNGYYLFTNLDSGIYKASFSNIPNGYSFTIPETAPNDKGSDVLAGGNTTGFITLPGGSVNLSIDAGIKVEGVGSIGDFVWNDFNKDGLQTPGELGIAGVIVTLYSANGNVLGESVTDGNGGYLFTNVPPGNGYYVNFGNLPTGYNFTYYTGLVTDPLNSDASLSSGNTTTFSVAAGQFVKTIDAGLYFGYPLDIQSIVLSGKLENSFILLDWKAIDNVATFSTYKLFRNETATSNSFVELTTLAANNNNIYNFVDKDILIGNNKYYVLGYDASGKILKSNFITIYNQAVNTINVYPNPATNVLNITFGSALIEPTEIVITDAIGNMVLTQIVPAGNTTSVLDISALATGVYLVKVTNEQTNSIIKFIKK